MAIIAIIVIIIKGCNFSLKLKKIQYLFTIIIMLTIMIIVLTILIKIIANLI